MCRRCQKFKTIALCFFVFIRFRCPTYNISEDAQSLTRCTISHKIARAMHPLSQDRSYDAPSLSQDRSCDAPSLTRSLVRCTLSLTRSLVRCTVSHKIARTIHSLSQDRTRSLVCFSTPVLTTEHLSDKVVAMPPPFGGRWQAQQCCGPRRKVQTIPLNIALMNHELQTHVVARASNPAEPKNSAHFLIKPRHMFMCS